MNGEGYTIHIGTDKSYVALYTPQTVDAPRASNYRQKGGLNHIAVTVSDIDDIELRVKEAGFEPKNHGDYEPGRRFYFHDQDDVEYEVVQYDNA